MRALFALSLLCGLLVACGSPSPTATPAFPRYTVVQVVAALMPLGITDVKQATRAPNAVAPNTYTENQEFTIPSIAPKGGQIMLFASVADVAGMQAWFARFPDLAPYVYVNGNALLQLNNTLPKAEAEKYRAALESLR